MSRTSWTCLVPALALLLTACTVATAEPAADDEAVEVFTNYRGRAADAFRDVLAAFSADTGIAVRHVGTADFAIRVRERVQEADPPDVALFPQPSLVREFGRDGRLTPLDTHEPDLADTMPAGAEDVGVVDGTRFGVWFRMSVKSLVWYPPATFRARGYDVPTTWDALLRLTARIEASGDRPWCMGIESFDATGWVGTDWIEDLVLRNAGTAVYDAWADGDVPFTDPRIEAAFVDFGRVALVEGRVLGGTRAILSTPALEAIQPLLEDPPRCLLTRQASFQESSLPDDTQIGPDGDVDVFALPPMDGGPAPLVAGGEIAAAFDDSPDAVALVTYLATPAAGEVWAQQGGFISPHVTFRSSDYGEPFDRRIADLVADAAAVRFDASDQMPPAVGTGTFWEGVVDYVAGAPLPTVLETIQAGYETASASPTPRN